jgi:hypothetical protein
MRQVVRSISLSKCQLWLKTNKKQGFGQVVFKVVMRAMCVALCQEMESGE